MRVKWLSSLHSLGTSLDKILKALRNKCFFLVYVAKKFYSIKFWPHSQIYPFKATSVENFAEIIVRPAIKLIEPKRNNNCRNKGLMRLKPILKKSLDPLPQKKHEVCTYAKCVELHLGTSILGHFTWMTWTVQNEASSSSLMSCSQILLQ